MSACATSSRNTLVAYSTLRFLTNAEAETNKMTQGSTSADPFKWLRAIVLWGLGAAAAGAAAIVSARYPLPFPWTATLVVLYGVLLFVKPELWLLVVPAVLPV